jgi:hypothetical protein
MILILPTRRMISRHSRPTSRGSSVNCDGLTQNMVNPSATCAGIASSARPRSATPRRPEKTARVPPTSSSSRTSRPAAFIASASRASSCGAGRPSGLKPEPYATIRSTIRRCMPVPPSHSAGPSRRNALGSK